MDLGLQGRNAFIAGASSGLGYAVAKQLLAEGCRVAICSRDEGRIQTAAQALTDDPTKVLPLVCDVTQEDQIQEAIAKAVAYFGSLNILVTNAGGPSSGFIGDFSASDWRYAMELNLLSTINLCRHALPPLRQVAQEPNGLARILMITSVSAKEPIPSLYLSNTMRAGVQGFAKSLSEELGPEGITVNTILPGYTRTERLTELAESVHERTGTPMAEIEAGWAEATALKRLAEPAEFAYVAVFLVSANASFITGAGIVVDGGRVKGLL